MMVDFLLAAFLTHTWIWRALGWLTSSVAIGLLVLGWRVGKIEARVARRFDLELSLVNALPEWLRWVVPESALGWAAAMAMLGVGLYWQWFAGWVDRQTR